MKLGLKGRRFPEIFVMLTIVSWRVEISDRGPFPYRHILCDDHGIERLALYSSGTNILMNDDVESPWKVRLKDVVRRNHRNPLVKSLAEAAKTYLRAYNNENHYNFTRNGEAFAIETAMRHKTGPGFVVVDVGANRGSWAREVLNRRPDSEVHCFEIAPEMYKEMEAELREFSNIRLNSRGLSDEPGLLVLNFIPGSDTMSSLYDQPLATRWGFDAQKVEVPVTTGDAYVAESSIEHIDFLKVDTEGHDLKVLRGFRDALSSRRVTIIQFEHGFVHISARSLLLDFYELLEPLGYSIGRLHPECVDFKSYNNCEDEQFRMGNYIAVHSSQASLIEALGVGSGQR
jgi:FkbM family methyltransferase